jgi:hypothetical protein
LHPDRFDPPARTLKTGHLRRCAARVFLRRTFQYASESTPVAPRIWPVLSVLRGQWKRRLVKTRQVQGARRGDSEAYDLYAAGGHEERNAADDAFSPAG